MGVAQMKIKLLTCLSFITIFTSNSFAKLPPQGISGGAATANIYLMLDTSGSMSATVQGNVSTPAKGGLQVGSQVNLAEYASDGRLWLYDAAYGRFLISTNGTLQASFAPSLGAPLALKRGASGSMLALFRSGTTRYLVVYSSSGAVQKTLTVSNAGSFMDQMCYNNQNNTVVLVDATGHFVVNLATNGVSPKYTFSSYSPTTPRPSNSSFMGCAFAGSYYYISSSSYGTYRFLPGDYRIARVTTTQYTELAIDSVNSTFFYGVIGSSIVRINASSPTISTTIINTGSFNTSYALTISPLNTNIISYANSVPQVYVYTNNIQTDLYYPTVTTMTRLDAAKQVIRDVLQDSEFNKRAYFGLMTWDSSAVRRVDIGPSSNAQILSVLPSIGASGGTDLYTAMQAASSYLSSSAFSTNASTCSKTIIIVISDGDWSNASLANNTASTLYGTRGIETYAIGFGSGIGNTANYQSLSIAGKSSPTSPMYANDSAQLKDRLKQALYVALASSFTSVAPTVMPSSQIGNLVIQPTFEYNSTGQWKGYLKAYTLSSSLTPSSLLWEFGANLNSVSPNSRKLWTVAPNLPLPANTGFNNFLSGYVPTSLKSAIFGPNNVVTDTDATTLLNFVRGFDAYDENSNNSTSDTRWKLQDIFHSRPIFIGVPKSSISSDSSFAGAEVYYEARDPGSYARFYASYKNRREIVLAGSNSGVLHAIDAKTGTELWGFIPPPMLRKLSELPSTNPSTGKKTSVSIYGIDGTLSARDLYVDGQWKTYVAITYGLGRRAVTVIDVTNPDVPKHIFSIDNVYEGGQWVLYRWDANGNQSQYNSTDTGNYSYRSLAYTTSSPVFAFMSDLIGRYIPILILGAGTTGTEIASGNVIYYIDIDGNDSGIVVERTTVGPWTSLTGFASFPQNDISTDVEVIESGRSERMKGRYGVEMFIPNSNGVLQTADFSGTSFGAVNLANSPRTIFNSETTVTNDRLITMPISISRNTSRKGVDDINIIFGTGDMDRLAIAGTSPDNYIYSIQNSEASLMSSSPVLTTASLGSTASSSAQCPLPSTSAGWKLQINSLNGVSKSGATIAMTYGKLASRIVQYGSSALIGIYAPQTSSACSMGNSCFFERDAACGYSKNSSCFSNAMIGGISVFGDAIFIGVSGNAGSESLAGGFNRTDNLISGKGNFTSTSSSGSLTVYGKQRKR